MGNYKSYKCPKCQIIKHIDVNENFDFKCKCCGGQMQYMGVVRKNSTEPYKKEVYYAYKPVLNSPQQTYTPKCPICGSANLSKISTVTKATKIGLFGIFGAGDIGKTWKCKNCGSRF